MSESILTVENLRVFHDLTEVVHGVSLEIQPGAVTGILGVNGAGKTALALALAGHLRSTGRVSFCGRAVEGWSPWARSHEGICLVQEGRRLFHDLTVTENLGLASWRRKKSRTAIASQLALVHDLFPVLKRKASEPVSRLSGGEQQMLAVGQGLMTFPKLLILDEPTAGLSPKIVGEMLTAISQLSREGYTAVCIDQSVASIRRVAEQVVVMRLGHVVDTLPARSIDDSVVEKYLG